jgi:hypothetical protein
MVDLLDAFAQVGTGRPSTHPKLEGYSYVNLYLWLRNIAPRTSASRGRTVCGRGSADAWSGAYPCGSVGVTGQVPTPAGEIAGLAGTRTST